jgi:prepilin-type N-terminal cleavage/methylation domain-containing protein
MTSRISVNTDPSRRPGRPRAFTLVELLVVIGIIVVLAGILLPMIGRAWRAATRTATANDLQAVATALAAYKQDWNDYPRVRFAADVTRADYSVARGSDDLKWRPNPQTGAEVLCFALMGMAPGTDATPSAGFRSRQDGADGPGFRPRRTLGADGTAGNADDLTGKIYPPYLPPDRFKTGAKEDQFAVSTDPDLVLHFSILDRSNMPILYFPASPSKPNVTVMGATAPNAPYVDAAYATPAMDDNSEGSRYDGDDNLVWFYDDAYAAMASNTTFTMPANAQKALKRIRGMLGDIHNSAMGVPTPSDQNDPAPTTPDGSVQRYEAAVDQPFLLWSAGPDDRFGPESISGGPMLTRTDRELLERCDDVTNFRP